MTNDGNSSWCCFECRQARNRIPVRPPVLKAVLAVQPKQLNRLCRKQPVLVPRKWISPCQAFNITWPNLADSAVQSFSYSESGLIPVRPWRSQTSDIRAAALGIASLKVDSHTSANNAISSCDSAISRVSAERSRLGAYQNRLEHTIKNLQTSSENLTSSESRIRDVDMAREMMAFTKNNILSQAAQAMLSQANQQPQGVLQLLA